MVEEPAPARPAPVRVAIGLDLGLKDLVVTSAGEHVPNPRHLRRRLRRLRREQRALARKRKGSGRWHAQRRRDARAYARVRDARAEALHQLTRRFVDENQVLAVEALSVRGLARSALAGPIADAAWGELLRQLTYKAAWAGREVVTIDRFEPTTRRCSGCSALTGPRGQAGLHIRRWRCPECGADHDRDANAAVNIERAGIARLPGGTGDVRRVEAGLPRAASAA